VKQEMTGGRSIEVVLFDFGGVLAEEGWKEGFRAIAEANGLDGEDLVRAAGDLVYATGYITGKGSAGGFWEAMREAKGIRGDDASLDGEIVSRFLPREWMFDVVERLKAENLKVGILSDQTDILDRLNATFDFFRRFDFVFNSYHFGKGKRDRSLFDDIASLLKTEPDRILFIDDDPGNIQRAGHSGWQTILYAGRNSFCASMKRMLPPG